MARVSFGPWLKQVGLAVLHIALFVAVGAAGSLGLLALAGWLAPTATPGRAAEGWRLVLQAAVIALAFLFATWLVGVKLLKRPWRDWGWRSPAGQERSALRGMIIGGVMAAFAVGLAVLGGARLRLESTVGAYVGAALPIALAFIAAALFEELVFRGLPLRRLAEALGPLAGTLLISVGFAAAHIGNPSLTLFGLVNIALAGIWLSVAFFSPGGMSLAWGLHLGWNATLALAFDAPVSGLVLHVPGPEYTVGRWAWFDGGRFGPEGGLVATIAMLAGTAFLLGDWGRRLVKGLA
jgi:membrane protease YdiL (CAAX protease family)